MKMANGFSRSSPTSGYMCASMIAPDGSTAKKTSPQPVCLLRVPRHEISSFCSHRPVVHWGEPLRMAGDSHPLPRTPDAALHTRICHADCRPTSPNPKLASSHYNDGEK